MSEDTFNAGTPEAPLILPLGDGKHGRSTILTTRHLLANVRVDRLLPSRTPTTYTPPLFGANDRFVRDNSESMNASWNVVRNAVDQQMGQGPYDPSGTKPSLDGAVVGRFDHTHLRADGPAARTNANVDPGNGTLQDFGQLLKDAYALLSPAKSKAEAEAFVALLGLTQPLRTYFTVSGGVYDLNPRAVQDELGDYGQVDNGKDGESSLKAILMALVYDPALHTPVNGQMLRLNAVADEPEQSLEYLALAQAVARTLGVDVRIIAAPTGAAGTLNPATDLAVIPLQSMTLTRTATGWDLQAEVTQGGVTQRRTIPVQYGLNGRGRMDPAHPLEKGWAPLNPGQRPSGSVH